MADKPEKCGRGGRKGRKGCSLGPRVAGAEPVRWEGFTCPLEGFAVRTAEGGN